MEKRSETIRDEGEEGMFRGRRETRGGTKTKAREQRRRKTAGRGRWRREMVVGGWFTRLAWKVGRKEGSNCLGSFP